MRAEEAAEGARGLLGALEGIRGVSSAIGLWARPDLKLHDRWVAGLPGAVFGRFSGDDEADRKTLDAWTAERTGGLIPRMPVQMNEAVELVLAAAQAVRTRWLSPFQEGELAPDDGPWAGRCLVGLRRATSLLDRVGVAGTAAGPLTVLQVLGDTGVDVHLLLGEEKAAPGAVLAAGIDVLNRTYRAVPGSLLPLGEPGPGLHVRHVRSTTRDPRLDVTTSPFSLTAEHDLLAVPELFGLSTASDERFGHFPGVGDFPPAINEARQSALARFTEQGFESATVTAAAACAGGAWEPPRRPYVVRRVGLAHDRPFGFLTVHRTSRLVLSAGWVAEPVDHVFEEYDGDEEGDGV